MPNVRNSVNQKKNKKANDQFADFMKNLLTGFGVLAQKQSTQQRSGTQSAPKAAPKTSKAPKTTQSVNLAQQTKNVFQPSLTKQPDPVASVVPDPVKQISSFSLGTQAPKVAAEKPDVNKFSSMTKEERVKQALSYLPGGEKWKGANDDKLAGAKYFMEQAGQALKDSGKGIAANIFSDQAKYNQAAANYIEDKEPEGIYGSIFNAAMKANNVSPEQAKQNFESAAKDAEKQGIGGAYAKSVAEDAISGGEYTRGAIEAQNAVSQKEENEIDKKYQNVENKEKIKNAASLITEFGVGSLLSWLNPAAGAQYYAGVMGGEEARNAVSEGKSMPDVSKANERGTARGYILSGVSAASKALINSGVEKVLSNKGWQGLLSANLLKKTAADYGSATAANIATLPTYEADKMPEAGQVAANIFTMGTFQAIGDLFGTLKTASSTKKYLNNTKGVLAEAERYYRQGMEYAKTNPEASRAALQMSERYLEGVRQNVLQGYANGQLIGSKKTFQNFFDVIDTGISTVSQTAGPVPATNGTAINQTGVGYPEAGLAVQNAAKIKANEIHEKLGIEHFYNQNDTVTLKDGTEVVVAGKTPEGYLVAKPEGTVQVGAEDIARKIEGARVIDKYLTPEKKARLNEAMDYKNTLKPVTQRWVEDFSGRTGIKIKVAEDANAEGWYNPREDTIYVTPDTVRRDLIKEVAMHEVTHAAETSPDYTAYGDEVLKIKYGTEEELRAAVEEVQERYAAKRQDLTDEEAKAELVAQFTRETLYKSPEEINAFVKGNPGIAWRIYDAIKAFIRKVVAFFKGDRKTLAQMEEYRQLKQLQQVFEQAFDTRVPEANAEATYSLNPRFAEQFDAWDKVSRGGYFKIGNTSDVLKSIGVQDQNIYWDKSKIADIQKKHPDMTDDVIKAVPQLLEDPVVVMQSNTVANRITMLGEVYDAAGEPVLAALELRPTGKNAEIQNFLKIASAYGKKNVRGLLENSDILYLDPNKNRTNRWLEARLGLRLPAGLTNYGSIGNVTYVNKDVNGKISFDDNEEKTAMQIAMEEASKNKGTLATTISGTDSFNQIIPPHDTDVNNKYSIKDGPEIGDIVEYTRPGENNTLIEKIKDNADKVAEMEPVADLSGNEFAKSEISLIDQVSDYFDEIGNIVTNPDVGDIVMNRRSVKDSIAHGIGRKKAAAFMAVPDVLRNGSIIDIQKNWKGRGSDTYVIAAPVNIGSRKHHLGAVVTSANGGNRFYLHEVLDLSTIKDGSASFKTGGRENPSLPGDASPSLPDTNIPSKKGGVKYSIGMDHTDMDAPAEGALPAEYETAFKVSEGIEGAKEIAKRQMEGEKEPDYTMPKHTDAPGEPLEVTDADKLFAYDEKEYIQDQIRRANAMVDSNYHRPKPKAGEVLRETGDFLYRKLVDQQAEINKYGQDMAWKANAVRAAAKSADFSIGYTTLKGKDGNPATYQTDITGKKKLGKSLADIWEPINGKGKEYAQEFDHYLLHLLNTDRMTLKERAARQADMLEAEAARIVEQNPYLTESVTELVDLARVNADGSDDARTALKLREQAAELKKKNNKPVFDDEKTADISRIAADKYEKAHPEFKGYAKEVYGYLDNLQANRIQAGLISETDAAVMKALYPHYVPMNMVEAGKPVSYADEKTQNVGKTVKRAKGNYGNIIGNVQDGIARQTRRVFIEGKINTLAQELARRADTGSSIFNVNYTPDGDAKGNVIRFYENGRLAEMEVNSAMMEAFKGFHKMSAEEPALAKAAAQVMNAFKAAITQYNPMFQGRQLIKDPQDAAFYTKYPKEFIKRAGEAAKEIANNGKYWQEYQAAGAFNASLYGVYAEAGTNKSRSKARQAMDKISNASMYIEQWMRLAEFIATRKNGGTIEEALYNAQDITGNFGRAGTLGRFLNRYIVPFFNASVQGFDKFVREIRSAYEMGGVTGGVKILGTLARGTAKLLLRASLLAVVPSVLNELLLGDDDDYKKLNNYVKEKYYLIKIGDGKFFRIPKGRVTSVIGNITQNAIRSARGESDAWDEYGKTVVDNIGPANPLTNNILTPMFGVAFNKNWWGGAIETQSDRKKAPEDRYDEKTSEIGKLLGKITGNFGISPKQVDYLLDQYTGVFGDIVLPLTTQAVSQNPIEKEYITDATVNNKLYDQTNDIERELNYAINKETKSDVPSVNDLSMRFMNRQNKEIEDLNLQIRDINRSSGAGRYEKVRELRKQINAENEKILENYPKFRAALEKYYDVAPDAPEEEQKKAADIAYLKAYRDVMGAEGAVEAIGKDAYEAAQEANAYGTSYDTYLDYYLNTRNIGKNAKKEDKVRVMAEMDVADDELAGLYSAAIETKSTEEKDSIIFAQEMGVRPWAFVQRELQTAGEKGEAGGTKEDVIYENGRIVYDEKGQTVSGSKKRQACANLVSSGYTDAEKMYFYQKEYGSDDNFAWAMLAGIPVDAYIGTQAQAFEGEKDANGKTVSGSVKNEYISYINSLPLDDAQKAFLVAQKYKVSGAESAKVRGYVNGLNISAAEKEKILASLKLSGGSSGRSRGRSGGGKGTSAAAKIPDSAWTAALAAMKKNKAPKVEPQKWLDLYARITGINSETMAEQIAGVDRNPLLSASAKAAQKAKIRKRYKEGGTT